MGTRWNQILQINDEHVIPAYITIFYKFVEDRYLIAVCITTHYYKTFLQMIQYITKAKKVHFVYLVFFFKCSVLSSLSKRNNLADNYE